MNEKAWKVSTVSILTSLNKSPTVDGVLVEDLKYTVLDDKEVSYHSAQDLAELHSINEKLAPKDFVAYRPERLALHETIVAVSTSLQLEDETEMQSTCKAIYKEVMKDLDSLNLDQIRANYESNVSELVERFLSGEDISSEPNGAKVAEICNQVVSSGAVFGNYKDGFTQKKAMITRATDVLYTEESNRLIRPLVARKIEENTTVKQLEIPAPSDRLTLMVAGGQASGKGSSVARLQEAAKKDNLKWSNFVKINTDSYKSLLLKPDSVKPELFSQLAQEEASVIHLKVQNRLIEKANHQQAPHAFIDQVFVGKDKIEYGLMKEGKVKGIIVSTDVGDAVERSYSRGAQEGRYENTQGILRCHKLMAQQVPTTLSNFVGQDVEFLLVDNNVAKGEQAENVMSVNLKTKELSIYSEINLERFAHKGKINEKATTRDNLYLESRSINHGEYMKPLIEKDCVIIESKRVSDNPNQYELSCIQKEQESQVEDVQYSNVPK